MSHDEILRLFGHDPNGVEISGVLRERHSQYWSHDLDKMLWKHSYSYGLTRKRQAEFGDIDPVKLLGELNLKSKPQHNVSSDEPECSFVLDWADWQVHKKEGGGVAGFIERFNRAMDAAVSRIVELRSIGRRLNELVIIGGGVASVGDVLFAPMREAYLSHLPARGFRPELEIKAAEFLNDAGLVGAADLARVAFSKL
jgi:hypothetical protein